MIDMRNKSEKAGDTYAMLTVIIVKFMLSGYAAALGMAWHLDKGFCTILGETLLGWAYVSFKLTQHIFGTTQGLF